MSPGTHYEPRAKDVLGRLKKVRRLHDGWSACCPAHEDKEPSLSVGESRDGKLLLFCHAGCRFQDILDAIGLRAAAGERSRQPQDYSRWHQSALSETPHEPDPARCDLQEYLDIFQNALPGSLGERYMRHRGIDPDLAAMYGVGYAAPGKWPHFNAHGRAVRQWKYGRLVFPHTNPSGDLLNFYGRAIGDNDHVPKDLRHAHLPGGKGYFNATTALSTAAPADEPLIVCEGPFDALSLISIGYWRVVAIFGVNGWKNHWVAGACPVIAALDNDEAGRISANKLAQQVENLQVAPREWYGNSKDLNESLLAGTLAASNYDPPVVNSPSILSACGHAIR